MFTMNSRRQTRTALSLPAHGTVELLAGMTMLVAPVVLGFGAAGIVVSVLLGSILMGMGMTLTGRIAPVVAWHSHFDSVFVLATAIAALALAAGGEKTAAVFLAALVGIQAVLNFGTRYVAAA
jgi:hypothetical protein